MAWERMVDVAILINELKRRHERQMRADELRTSLGGGNGVDVGGFGELILEVVRSRIHTCIYNYIKWIYVAPIKATVSKRISFKSQ